jgi:hypothetical protein
MRTTSMDISPLGNSGTPSWTLKGFETIRATGALQLAAGP